MRQVLTAAAAAALALALGAAPAIAQDKLKVGFVYVGPVGDFGWSYQHDVGRQALESTVTDLNAFLKSLELSARIAPVTGSSLERSVQLINRSNQFNVTTKRYSNADLLAMLENPAWLTRTVSLRDRFGDNGLISVLLAEVVGTDLRIDTWLMSCRVLKRGVENFLVNHLVAAAQQRGCTRVLGQYLPTPKNGLVKDATWHIDVSKTGYISEAGRCLVMQARIGAKPVVIVLLDSWGRYTRIGDANRIKRWMEAALPQSPG